MPDVERTISISGLISDLDYDDGTALHLSSMEAPLTEYLLSEIKGKRVRVRIWTSHREITDEDKIDIVAKMSAGVVDGQFGARYSETTGFLWVDDELIVGGHNIALYLFDHVGEYAALEIDVYAERQGSDDARQ